MSAQADTKPELLTPREVGELFRVSPKTVSRWSRAGKLSTVKTMGGHRRFRRSEIEAVLAQSGESPDTAASRLANA